MATTKSSANDNSNKFFTPFIIVLAIAIVLFLIYSVSSKVSAPNNNQINEQTSSSETDPNSNLNNDATPIDLTSYNWLWQNTVMGDETVISPNQVNAFVAHFEADPVDPENPNIDPTISGGLVSVTTDCNNASGRYTLSGNQQISFSPLATTMMFCGENSQESVFVQQISSAVSYIIDQNDQNTLHIALPFDSGIMNFVAVPKTTD